MEPRSYCFISSRPFTRSCGKRGDDVCRRVRAQQHERIFYIHTEGIRVLADCLSVPALLFPGFYRASAKTPICAEVGLIYLGSTDGART